MNNYNNKNSALNNIYLKQKEENKTESRRQNAKKIVALQKVNT